MNLHAISAPLIFDGTQYHQRSAILINHKTVDSIVPVTSIPTNISHKKFDKGLITPGFIDLQVNGGGGILLNDVPSVASIQTIINAHRSLGTHAILPTLITSDDTTIIAALDAIEEAISENIEGLLGIHLEGPMINIERSGVHSKALIRILNDKILARIDPKKHRKIIITLAPEYTGLSLIQELTDSGIYVFAGHTAATPDLLEKAVEHGLRGFTHIYNAMPQMESRKPNTTGFALQNDCTWGSIIYDGFHIDPIMIDIAIRAKPQGKLFLVSDSMSTIGSTLTSFTLDGKTIYRKDGKLVNAENTLAGADIALSNAVINLIKRGYSLELAIAMASSYPAESIEETQYGFLKSGYTASINHFYNNQITPINI